MLQRQTQSNDCHGEFGPFGIRLSFREFCRSGNFVVPGVGGNRKTEKDSPDDELGNPKLRQPRGLIGK